MSFTIIAVGVHLHSTADVGEASQAKSPSGVELLNHLKGWWGIMQDTLGPVSFEDSSGTLRHGQVTYQVAARIDSDDWKASPKVWESVSSAVAPLEVVSRKIGVDAPAILYVTGELALKNTWSGAFRLSIVRVDPDSIYVDFFVVAR